jgi:hypothetical protein
MLVEFKFERTALVADPLELEGIRSVGAVK